MMTFFEFFFSGPGWGWKVFALICFTSLFVELIPRTTNAILDYKLKKYQLELEWLDKNNDNDTNDTNNEDTPATVDDVRQ